MRNFLTEYKFTIYKNFTLSTEDEEVLSLLYLPIIKKNAYSLYFIFYNLIKLQKNVYFFDSNEIFNKYGYSAKEIIESIRTLEAIHLLKTYQKEKIDSNNNINDEFIFKLISPASSEKFFKDVVLRSLLFSKVNDEKCYEKLKQIFKISLKKEDTSYVDVSCNFNDVFSIPNIIQDDVSLDDYNDKKYLSEDSFDDEKFYKELKENNISISLIQDYYEEIKNLSILYGLTIDDLLICINKSISLEDNKFYFDKFKKQISNLKKYESNSIKTKNENVNYDENLISAINYFSHFNSVEEFLATKLNNKPDKNLQKLIQSLKLQYKFSNVVIMIILDYSINKTNRFNENYISKICQSIQLKADINDPYSVMSTILNISKNDKKALSKKENKNKDVVDVEEIKILNKIDDGILV